ncbi:MAG: O-antigen ligase family protein [Chloroflexi bacterium]|nr:O-antigen ligase family protein [Chloroflexota bacterium]
MKNIELRLDDISPPPVDGRIDRLSLILGLIAIAISAASALAIGQFGALILLVVPAVVFLLVVFIQPDYGLLIFVFITVTQVSNVAINFYDAPSIAQPLAGLLMAVILLRMVIYRELPLNWRQIAPVLVIYIIALFISMFNADDFEMSSAAFIGFFKDALGGVIVILLIQRPGSFRKAIWALVIAGMFMGSISMFQTVTRTYDNNYFGFGRWESQTAGQDSRNRLTGPYDNPNAYSQVMVVIFVLALERLWHEKRSLLRLIAGWSVIVCGLTIVFTYSRGGVLTLLAATGVLFLQNRPRILPVLLTAVVGLALVQFLPADYTSYISTVRDLIPTQTNDQVNDSSFRGRLSENLVAMQMFEDDPLFGVGLGNYQIQYQNYSRQIGLDHRRVTRNPSSLYLEVLSEQGVIGAAAFLLLLYTIFSGLITSRRKFSLAGMNDHSNLTMALLAGLAGYMIAALVKNSAYSNVYWVLVGIALSAVQVSMFSLREKSELAGFSKSHGR